MRFFRYTFSTLFCTLAIGLASGIVTTLRAQQAGADTATLVYPMKQVTVSATRIPEQYLNVPAAVSSVPAYLYNNTRGYELKDALWSVPGVLATSRAGSTDLRITIRGYGARGAGNRSNAGNLRGIRVLVDGVPETEPDGRTSLDLVDLGSASNVEVLRSNASTLYGNASGGVINLITNTDFAQSFAQAKFNTGSFGYNRTTLQTGVMLGTSNLLLSATNTNYGGYRTHSGSSQLLLTAGLRSRLSDATTLGLSMGATSNLFRFPGALTKAEMDANPLGADSQFVARDERRFNRVGRMSVTLDHNFSTEHAVNASIFFQPKVIQRSERNSFRDFNRYNIGAQGRYQWNTKFGETVASTLTAGADESFQDGTLLFYSLGPGGSRGTTLTQNKAEAASTFGAYAEETLSFGDFSVKAGGRYDVVSYDFRNFIAAPAGLPQRKQFTHFTPKAALLYRLSPWHSVYASFGGGLETPAYNEIDPPSDSLVIARGGTPDTVNKDFNPNLVPATSTSIELGARGVLENTGGVVSGFTYDIAAYMIKVENDLVPWNGGTYYFNAAKTTRVGLELALAAATTFGLSGRGTATISNNTYDQYQNLLGTYNGNKMAGLPGVYGNIRLRYNTPVKAWIELGAEFTGSYYADDRNDKLPNGSADVSAVSLVPAARVLTATVGYSVRWESVNVDLFATAGNITDAKTVSSVFINGVSNRYFEPGMPRNFVVGISVKNIFQ